MLGDLRPIAANRHAAPAAAMGFACIEEPERAARTFAMADIREVRMAHQIGDGLRDGLKHGVWRIGAMRGA
jgi:hypothetical protein